MHLSMIASPRKGATRISAIPPEILAALNAGTMESRTLAEGLAIDFVALLQAVSPRLLSRHLAPLRDKASAGITEKMKLAAVIATEVLGERDAFTIFAPHSSDTVRGIAAAMVGLVPELSLGERFSRIRRFADDTHFGVREWAWLALRPAIVAAPREALQELLPCTSEPSAFLRRFAVEAMRPRGVWAAHIRLFKEHPALGLPLLEPLKADESAYVQDSVANWLNDAAKSNPDWVRKLCTRWSKASASPHTARIVRRAQRSIAAT